MRTYTRYLNARWLIAVTGVAVIVAGAHLHGQQPRTRNAPASEFRGLPPAQAEALQRRIEQTIVEQGVVESADVVELPSRTPGEAIVFSAAPDGSVVKKGDVIVTLDDSAARRELQKQQIVLRQAQADVERAKAGVEAARKRAAAEIPVAESIIKAAKLASRRYLDEEGGEYATKLAESERQIAVARKRLEVAKRRAEAVRQSEGVLPDELELMLAEAQAQLDAALAAEQLLTRHIHPHEAAVLELGILRAESQSQQIRDAADAAQRAAEAELGAAESQRDLAERRLDELDQQVRQCRILAPRDGVVLHAVSAARRTTTSGLEPGATIREGQLLMKMPDLERLRVRVHVHESQIARVKPDQAVSLRLDALPTRRFSGRVAEISRAPEPTQWFSPEVQYAVVVEIPSLPPEARIGMTVLAEIDVASDSPAR
ncbi:MAG: HlyD family efflux transporter periplasmic adaptor subunit [Planctomycetales bacterium]|nr:HlyD family efflux transporter periplasmic adaptor subunit [Planctomycetales bacterium]